ncbi:pol polyprotein [Tanacetum coccineum]
MIVVPTRRDDKYFITFIDDSTKYWYVYLLKSKDEAIDKFILYKNEVENQLNKKIKVIRSNRGGEYVSSFAEFCSQHGIRHELTALYSPQQNGIAERKNHTLKEMANAMLRSSGSNKNMRMKAHLEGMTWLSKKRDNEMIMSFTTRDIINLRKKMLNLEEAKGPELRNRLDPILYL